MNNINLYRKRFNRLLESTIGDVKPIISEEGEVISKSTYVSEEGDTVETISKKLGLSTQQIIKMNPMLGSGNEIKPNTEIKIK